MHTKAFGGLLVNGLEELQELLVTVTRQALPDHDTGVMSAFLPDDGCPPRVGKAALRYFSGAEGALCGASATGAASPSIVGEATVVAIVRIPENIPNIMV